jgi:hypothetical protein
MTCSKNDVTSKYMHDRAIYGVVNTARLCAKYLFCTFYNIPVQLLRLRKMVFCIYLDVINFALYKHSVMTRSMLALYCRRDTEKCFYFIQLCNKFSIVKLKLVLNHVYFTKMTIFFQK